MNYKNVGIISLIFVALATTVHAQPRPDKDWKDWFGQFHGGWSVAQGEFGEVVDDGFSMNGGATYWPEDWPVGLVLEMGYNEFDLSSSTIQGINDEIDNAGGEGMITGGWVSSLAVTASVTWSPSSSGRGFYLIGGAGVYRIEGKITETGLVFYPPVCDPWFWWCSPGGVGPGTFVSASETTTEFGWNAGAGWAFEVGDMGSQIYIETRFHSALTSPEETSFLPLTIGYRW